MLALNRKLGESVWIGSIEIRVIELHRGQVRLCIDAPKNFEVLRDELRSAPIVPGKFEVPVPRVAPAEERAASQPEPEAARVLSK